MTKPIWRLAAGLLGLSILMACQTGPTGNPQARPSPDAAVAFEAPRVTPDALKQRLDAGEPIVIVDVRPAAAYAAGHIRDAVNLPWADLEANYAQLPKDRFIALYCT